MCYRHTLARGPLTLASPCPPLVRSAVPGTPSPRLPLLVTLTVAPAPGHAPDGRPPPAPPPPPPDPGLAFPPPAPPRTLSYTKLLYGAGFNASYCDERSPGFLAEFKW